MRKNYQRNPISGNLREIFTQYSNNPDDKYHPYVRWWWNGVRLSEKEILRELDLMKKIGIGGVEINSIKFPKDADSLSYKVMPYLSDDWARMIRIAADGCKARGNGLRYDWRFRMAFWRGISSKRQAVANVDNTDN